MRVALTRLAVSLEDFTPEQIALILALGLAFGTFPLPGGPTALCALAAVAMRLNFPALQLVNYLSTPLQLILFLPFARLGSRLLSFPADQAWSLHQRVGGAALGSVAGWFCISAPLGIVLYFSLLSLLKRGLGEWFNGLESPA